MLSKIAVMLLVSCYCAHGNHPSPRTFPTTSIKVQFYFGSTTLTGQATADQLISSSAKFNSAKKSYFITHGWESSVSKPWFIALKDAILAKEPTANVFMVDWSTIGQSLLYPVVKKETVAVGQLIAHFIAKNNIDPKKVHFIGHSLGAHVAGNTAYAYYLLKGIKLLRVTGLDPATPLFPNFETPLTEKLDKSDADFVDIIFTSMAFFKDLLGLDYSMGHVNFYVNGGDSQPGCLDEVSLSLTEFLSSSPGRWKPCSHDRSIDLFIDSIKYDNLVGYNCSYPDLINGRCSGTVSNRLGYNVKADPTGDFVLTTTASSPFAKDDFNLKVTINSIDVLLGIASGTLSMTLPFLKNLALASPLVPVRSGQTIQKFASVPFGSVAANSVVSGYWATPSLLTSGSLKATITLATPNPTIKSFTIVPTPAVLKNGVATNLTVK